MEYDFPWFFGERSFPVARKRHDVLECSKVATTDWPGALPQYRNEASGSVATKAIAD